MTKRILQAAAVVSLGLMGWHPSIASALVAVAAILALAAQDWLHFRLGAVAGLLDSMRTLKGAQDVHGKVVAGELEKLRAELGAMKDKVSGLSNAAAFRAK